MRFETEVVEIGTALLSDDSETFAAIEESLLAQVSELPLTVNVVALEKDLIEERPPAAMVEGAHRGEARGTGEAPRPPHAVPAAAARPDDAPGHRGSGGIEGLGRVRP